VTNRLATLKVLVSCSSAVKPGIRPGQVIALDDGTLTTRADHQELDGGRSASLSTRPCRARTSLASDVHAIEAPEQGYFAAMRGLDDMGTEYLHVKKPMFDDT